MSTGRARDEPASTPSFSSEHSWPPAVGALHCCNHAPRRNPANEGYISDRFYASFESRRSKLATRVRKLGFMGARSRQLCRFVGAGRHRSFGFCLGDRGWARGTFVEEKAAQGAKIVEDATALVHVRFELRNAVQRGAQRVQSARRL